MRWHRKSPGIFGFGRNPMIADPVLSALEYHSFPEKPRHFGLRFVHADADVAEKLGLVPDIRAQLCPEMRALPPGGGQVHDRPDVKAVIPRGKPRRRYDRRPIGNRGLRPCLQSLRSHVRNLQISLMVAGAQ